jgi:hypothetical protein
MSLRPVLNKFLSSGEFEQWYYLKIELQTFCSENRLPTAGSKIELQARIISFLKNGLIENSVPKIKAESLSVRLNEHSALNNPLKLNASLRLFFTVHFGSSFAFNHILREFFKAPKGRTISQAVDLYRESIEFKKNNKNEISDQFQYNQFTRNFFLQNKTATKKEAIEAWWKYRNSPK